MKRLIYRLGSLFLCVVVVCALLAAPAQAQTVAPEDPIKTNEPVSLTIEYKVKVIEDGTETTKAVEGVSFQLYKVATVDKNCAFQVTDGFKEANPVLVQTSSSGWLKVVDDLSKYIKNEGANKVKAVNDGKTDKNGELTFSKDSQGNPLLPGLYLAVGEKHEMEGDSEYVYAPNAFLITLPYVGGDGKWTYDVVVYPKYTKISTKSAVCSVHKNWKTSNKEELGDSEKKSVTVVLYQDDAVYDEVTLTGKEAKPWSYEWRDLPGGYRWTVKEEACEGFTITIDEVKDETGNVSEYFFEVYNIKTPPPDPDPTDPTPSPTSPGTNPPGTNPPGTNPPGTNPPGTNPPGTNPPGTNPPGTNPPGTNPPSTNPPRTSNPPSTNPPSTNPPRPSNPPSTNPPTDIPDDPTPLGPPPNTTEIDDDPPPLWGDEVIIDDEEIPLGELPQTGMLWWPVPVLAGLGMALFVFGWILDRRDESYAE